MKRNAGGRSAIPTYCQRCGVRCASWSKAAAHCPKPTTVTDKQRQTLDLLITGARYQRIADQMGVDLSTITERVADLCHKFGLPKRCRYRLAVYWAQSKLRG